MRILSMRRRARIWYFGLPVLGQVMDMDDAVRGNLTYRYVVCVEDA